METDRKQVKADFIFEFFKMKNKKHLKGIDTEKLKNEELEKKYQSEIEKKIEEKEDEMENDGKMKWKIISKRCIQAGKEVLGRVNNKLKCQSSLVKALSEEKKKLRLDIEANKDKKLRDGYQWPHKKDMCPPKIKKKPPLCLGWCCKNISLETVSPTVTSVVGCTGLSLCPSFGVSGQNVWHDYSHCRCTT